VDCSWFGGTQRIAQKSCLLLTENEFAKVAGMAKVLVVSEKVSLF